MFRFVLKALLLFSSTTYAHSFTDKLSGAMTWKDPTQWHDLSTESKNILNHALVDIPAVIDVHMHLVCRQPENGCFVPQSLFSYRHPFMYFQTQMMMSALGVKDQEHPDLQIVERLESLLKNFPKVPYVGGLLAFAASFDPTNKNILYDKTGLSVPNKYMQSIVTQNPHNLFPVHSLHPFESDLSAKFASFLKNGRPLLLKVLPNSMNFAPDDERTSEFFAQLALHRAVLLTHVGSEHSVEGGGIDNAHGNPLLYEKWLQRFPSLRIIFAHAGIGGQSIVNAKGDREDNFDLVLKMMRKYPQQTYADLSGFAVSPNRAAYLRRLVQAEDLHPRLLYGSDYPLVAIKPLMDIVLWDMYLHGLLGGWEDFRRKSKAILEIYDFNPLAAAFVALRGIAYNGRSLPVEVFFGNARKLVGDPYFTSPLPGGTL